MQRQNSNTYDSASRVSFDLPRKYREEEGRSKKTLLAGKTRTEQYADTQANQLRNPRFQLIKKSIPEHGYVYMSLKKWGAGEERLISGYYCLRKLSGTFWGRCAEEPFFIYIKTSIITNHEKSELKKNMAVSCK